MKKKLIILTLATIFIGSSFNGITALGIENSKLGKPLTVSEKKEKSVEVKDILLPEEQESRYYPAAQKISIGQKITLSTGTTSGTQKIYKINVTAPGKLTINSFSFGYSKYIRLEDSEKNQIAYNHISGSSVDPDAGTIEEYLNPGTYYIKVENNYNGYDGKVEFSTTLKTKNLNEVEPNSGTLNAQKINLKTIINGKLGYNDSTDTFALNVSKPGILDLKLATATDVDFEILDSAGKRLTLNYITGGSEFDPKHFHRSIGLNPGKYYIRISKYSSNRKGFYEMKTNFFNANSSDTEPNNGTVNANSLSLNTNLTGFLANSDYVDTFKFYVPKGTYVTVNCNSYSNQNVQLLNASGNRIAYDYNYGSNTSPELSSFVKHLDKGTYYIKIENRDHFGKYVVSVNTNAFSDIRNHWAKKEIEYFANRNYVSSTKSNFYPDKSITRAEFIKLVNKTFNFSSLGTEKFTDVSSKDWFYNEVRKGIKAGYISTKNSKFRPHDPITREEAAKIIVDIKNKRDTNYDKLNKYKDKYQVSSWAKSSVEGAIEQGYMGQGSSYFRPKNNITRAEAVVTLYRVANFRSL